MRLALLHGCCGLHSGAEEQRDALAASAALHCAAAPMRTPIGTCMPTGKGGEAQQLAGAPEHHVGMSALPRECPPYRSDAQAYLQ